MWTEWTLPKNEGTRIHRFGKAMLCVSADMAGEGDVLAAMPFYPESSHALTAAGKKKAPPALCLPPLADPAWTRYYMGKTQEYRLSPGYPTLPVCVRLRESFSLPPGADIQGWIFSHIEARIMVGAAMVASFPLRKPFKTMYGNPESGVVCRYDEADFLDISEPTVDSLHQDPSLVAHPVRLKNGSVEPVLVSELCIYGEQLSVYGVDMSMQSERLSFAFSDSGVRMRLDGQGALPPKAVLLTKPKVSGEERFIERSFELFKAMTRL
jgi:hypothetical protein